MLYVSSLLCMFSPLSPNKTPADRYGSLLLKILGHAALAINYCLLNVLIAVPALEFRESAQLAPVS